jgi:hypothetical protein
LHKSVCSVAKLATLINLLNEHYMKQFFRLAEVSVCRSRKTRHRFTVIHSPLVWRTASSTSSIPTVQIADVSAWDTHMLIAHCRDVMKLQPATLALLKHNKVSGRSLLGLDKDDLKGLGLLPGSSDQCDLLAFITLLRYGVELENITSFFRQSASVSTYSSFPFSYRRSQDCAH